MKRLLRPLLVATVAAAPFVLVGTAVPASATCRPEKPSTCEMYCPSGNWVYVGPAKVCVPVDGDFADLQTPERP